MSNYRPNESFSNTLSTPTYENNDQFDAYRVPQYYRAGVSENSNAASWARPSDYPAPRYVDYAGGRQLDLSADIYHRQAYSAAESYSRYAADGNRGQTRSEYMPPVAPTPQHYFAGSFVAGNTTCDITMTKKLVDSMPNNTTGPYIQEIPDNTANPRAYHSLRYTISKQQGNIDINVLGLSHQHANAPAIFFDQANGSVHLHERLQPAHAAIAQTHVLTGVASQDDYNELARRQSVPVYRPYVNYEPAFMRR